MKQTVYPTVVIFIIMFCVTSPFCSAAGNDAPINPAVTNEAKWPEYPLRLSNLSGTNVVMEALSKAKTNPYVRFNPDGATPLHMAADWADTGAVATLLAMGADVNAVDCRKNPPLIRAINNGRGAQRTLAVEVVKQLLDAGADVNQKGFMNQTALHIAYKMIDRRGSQPEGTNLIELLLQNGADPTLKDASGHVPKWNMPEQGHMGMGVLPPPPQQYSSP